MKYRSEIQSLFDIQIRGIIRRIDEQLEWMRINRSNECVVRSPSCISFLFCFPPVRSCSIISPSPHLKVLNTNKPQKKYIVLSGGLGGSPYVKTQLEAKYGSTSLSIIRSQEPRL